MKKHRRAGVGNAGVVALAAALLAAAVAAVLLLPARRSGPALPAADPALPRYRESPILRDRVQRGELPPVEQRLPEQPLVVPPVDGIGRYDSSPRTPAGPSP